VIQKIVKVERLGDVGIGASGETCSVIGSRRQPADHEDWRVIAPLS
jgi:hypothetical protein